MAELLFNVLKNDKIGRYLVTSEPLSKGTLIFSDVPFALGPKPDSPPVCLGCHGTWNRKYKCSLCNWPCCSLACEQLSIHRDNECQVFRQNKIKYQNSPKGQPCLQYDCITPLRMLLAKEQLSERWKEEVEMMEDHNTERKERSSWDVDQVNVVEYLRGPCKLGGRFSEELIQRVCGILEVNSVEIPLLYGPNLRGIYPKVAIMSHSCVPSIVHTIIKEDEHSKRFYRAQIWAATDLKKGDKLELCYTQVLQSTLERRDFLKLSKFFECDCKRCGDPTELGTEMSTLLCNKCEDGFVRAINPLEIDSIWKCSKCNYETTNSNVRKLLKVIHNEIALTEKYAMGPGEIESVEQLIIWLSRILHPRHSVFVTLWYNLLQLYGRVKGYELESLPMKLLKRKVNLCKQVIHSLDIISPGQTRIKGMTLFELHSALIFLSKAQYENSIINKTQLEKKLKEVSDILLESAIILSREDKESEKGAIGRAALTTHSDLVQTIGLIAS